MKRFIKWSCLLSLFVTSACFALDLELTKGLQGAMPIAIVPFAGNDSSSSLIDVAAIVNADLQNSGRFQVLDRGRMHEQPHSAAEVNPATWQKLDIDNVVVGNIKSEDGKYHVDFALTNTAGKTQTLLSKDFVVPENGMRGLAHHISDLIYEKLTGDKGVFSTHIAYVVVEKQNNLPSRYRLEVADYDGYNPRNVVVSQQPIMSPSWSPDGQKIAYVSFEKSRAGIYLQDVSTGTRKLLTDFQGINGSPSWSADGKKLAFVLSKEGSPNIFTLDLATNNLVQRTTGTNIDTEPSWAPDGSALVFTSNRSGGPQVYRVNLATSDIQRLTYEGNYNTSASFTPDGKNIVFLHQEDGQFRVAIQNLQTNKMDILTNTGKDQHPRVAPNGSMILFATRMGTRQVLNLVSADSRAHVTLPTRGSDVREPDWSPL